MDGELQARIVELETRLAFQEQALTELSDALAAARVEMGEQLGLLRRELESVKQSPGGFYADPADEPPPPHY